MKRLEDTFGDRYSLMRMMDSRKQAEQLMKTDIDSNTGKNKRVRVMGEER